MTDTNGFIGMAEFVQERLYIQSHDILLHTVFGFYPHPLLSVRQVNHWGPCLYCTENFKHIFPDMKLQGLVPNSYIHVSGRSYLEFPISCIV